ncbi:hypothetical protein [Terriglobus aquaticus]|uniref:Uncharacterized protein n=1 Tax=Terriglobus aquaticus TaxID=940139 RepID=A0ABW9KF89_9BACT|nr:hypothetical protein [Terriglobus aquaticus]
MQLNTVRAVVGYRSWLVAITVLLALAPELNAQQVVARGAFGKPAQVLDQTGQWSTPLQLASDSDVQIFMPDVSNPDWLKSNYDSYQNQGNYTLSLFTRYKRPDACRANQTAWGLGDAAHLNACATVGYRVHTVRIDPHSRSVILLQAAMTDQNGNVIPSLVEKRTAYRSWDQLDATSLSAVKKANDLVAAQMKSYYDRLNNPR